MNVDDDYRKNLKQVRYIADLISCTYQALLKEIGFGSQEVFLGSFGSYYCYGRNGNGTRDFLISFFESICLDMQHMLTTTDQEYKTIFDVVVRVESGLVRMPNTDLQDCSMMGCCLYIILLSIDCYWAQCGVERAESVQSSPLNRNGATTGCFVYDKEPNSSWRTTVYQNGSTFRKMPEPITIAHSLSGYSIVDRSMLDGEYPHHPIIYHWQGPPIEMVKGQPLKIACVPMLNEMYLEFVERSTNIVSKLQTCKDVPQGNFTVRIGKKWRDKCQKRAIEALRHAIDLGAVFVVFPEYAIDKECFEALEKVVNESQEIIEQKPFAAVIAGSWYCFKNRKGNNKLSLIGRYGQVIKYGSYKYVPYCTFDDELQLPYQTEPVPQKIRQDKEIGMQNCELLSNPGYKCCLVDKENIGRILPSVCKDSVTGHLLGLFKLFHPSFLITVAWSGSLSFFKNNFIWAANTSHVTSILCNSCWPCRNTKKPDLICAPWRNGHSMDSNSNCKYGQCPQTDVYSSTDCEQCVIWFTINQSLASGKESDRENKGVGIVTFSGVNAIGGLK